MQGKALLMPWKQSFMSVMNKWEISLAAPIFWCFFLFTHASLSPWAFILICQTPSSSINLNGQSFNILVSFFFWNLPNTRFLNLLFQWYFSRFVENSRSWVSAFTTCISCCKSGSKWRVGSIQVKSWGTTSSFY